MSDEPNASEAEAAPNATNSPPENSPPENSPPENSPPENSPPAAAPEPRSLPWLLLLLGVVLVIVWIVKRPGLFVVQPIGAVPDGVTVLYLSRGDDVPFIESPDGICLRTTGGVNLLCRGVSMTAFMRTAEPEIVARLPYSEWLYLQTTDGRTFGR